MPYRDFVPDGTGSISSYHFSTNILSLTGHVFGLLSNIPTDISSLTGLVNFILSFFYQYFVPTDAIRSPVRDMILVDRCHKECKQCRRYDIIYP
jgi:hypothetical protein